MQDDLFNSPKRFQMTITLNEDDLALMNEGDVLRVAMAAYQMKHPRENVLKAFPMIIDRTRPHLDRAIGNETSIGAECWMKIEDELGIPLYQTWVALRTKRRRGTRNARR